MYEMIFGFKPFRSNSDKDLIRKIKNENQSYGYKGIEISDEAKDLINKLLNKNSKLRISAKKAL
jgi:serine/threonine protein kinase